MRGPDSRGPELRGVTSKRGWSNVARVVVSVAIVLGVIGATEGWNAIKRRAGLPVGQRGAERLEIERRAARQVEAKREGATARGGTTHGANADRANADRSNADRANADGIKAG